MIDGQLMQSPQLKEVECVSKPWIFSSASLARGASAMVVGELPRLIAWKASKDAKSPLFPQESPVPFLSRMPCALWGGSTGSVDLARPLEAAR